MKVKLLLTIILVLGAILRFLNLDYHPPGFYSDEASYAYNAFSILKTAKDEHGKQMPLVFEAFGDYKLPVMLYSIVGSFAVFGASDWSARLPGAMYGVFTILAIYLLAKQILKIPSKDTKTLEDQNYQEYVPLISALLLAITPSHIFVSRGTWELTPSLLFITLATWLLLKIYKQLKDKEFLGFKGTLTLLLAVVVFALSMYAYNSARVFVPLFIIGFAVLHYKETITLIIKNRISTIVVLGFTILLLLPILVTLTSPQVTQRATYISIFYDKSVQAKLFDIIRADGGQPVIQTRLLHNKPVLYFMDFSSRYLSHFDPNFLFITGDTFEIFRQIGLGFLPLISAPFFLYGVYRLLIIRPLWFEIMLLWLILSPIASSFTIFTPSTSRTMNMVVPLTIFTAYGVVALYLRVKANQGSAFATIGVATFAALLVINTGYIFNRYFIQTPKVVAEKWNDGYKETVEYISKIEKNYDKVVISSSQAPSYIFYAWNLRYDPVNYQKEAQTNHTPDEHGLNFTSQFSKYYFTKNISQEIKNKKPEEKILFVGFPDEFTGETQVAYSRNNKPVFIILE